MHLKSSLPAALKYQALVVESTALEAGLDFDDVVFELLDAVDVNGIASYGGFPVRYPSWRFGMDYERLEKGYRWGLAKIYELVINNAPVYAYLVRSNSLLEQKLVMAHVFGHADFFKNNVWFGPTERNMLDVMGGHATRVRRYVDSFGLEEVERFLDCVLSCETLIDPYLPLRERRSPDRPAREGEPTSDVLGFLAERAPVLPWQRDVLRMVRREAYYFVPQRMTQIMNEGWASFWHSRLLTRTLLEPSEIVDFADTHSGATTARPGELNPYKLGLELWRWAETTGQDIFRLRRLHNDVSFIDALVDQDFAERSYYFADLGLPGAPEDWRARKARLLAGLSFGGLPEIELAGHERGSTELCLVHHHDGRDLQLDRAGHTLVNVERVWHGPVSLLTLLDGSGKKLVCEDGEVRQLECAEALERCRRGVEPEERAG